MDVGQRYRQLLEPLFREYDRAMVPATQAALDRFRERAREAGVPPEVIAELAAFYEVTDGVPCLDSFDFHAAGDEILFEWWNARELWLGQRDFYTLRWASGRFCLGDASNVSFSPEHETATLVGLLELALKEWS